MLHAFSRARRKASRSAHKRSPPGGFRRLADTAARMPEDRQGRASSRRQRRSLRRRSAWPPP
eukprot:6210783-Pleurochrysis_carterae.AAC.2